MTLKKSINPGLIHIPFLSPTTAMPDNKEYTPITQQDKKATASLPKRVMVLLLCMSILAILLLAEYMDTTYTAYQPVRRVTRECPSSPIANGSTVVHPPPVFVVYIPSPIAWRERRQRVLRQMRPELSTDTHLYFVFGTRDGPQLENEIDILGLGLAEAALETDQRVHYLFTDCRDLGHEVNNPNGTSSTTCKTYEALRHVARTYSSSPPLFVWRWTDNGYLDLNVFRTLVAPQLQRCRLFLGRLEFPQPWDKGDPLDLSVHQPRLYGLFGVKKLGKFMDGMGFCMSWDVVLFIGLGTIPPHLTFPEDVIVSQWLVYYDVDWLDIHDVNPGIGMYDVGDGGRLLREATVHQHALLAAHKMSQGQWAALGGRTNGNLSYAFVFAK